jgi:cytosine/uracil/thiamine/allantoin permease
MEFIDTKAITGKLSSIVGLDPTDPTNILNRMGIMFLIIFGIVVTTVSLGIVSFFVSSSYQTYKRYR